MTSTQTKPRAPADAHRGLAEERARGEAPAKTPPEHAPSPTTLTTPAGEGSPSRHPSEAETLFEPGFGKAVVLGGLVGFLVVFALSSAAFIFLTTYGLGTAVGASVFVGAFGGVGFGAMVAASLFG